MIRFHKVLDPFFCALLPQGAGKGVRRQVVVCSWKKFQTVVLIVVDEHYSNTRNITTLIRWLFILPLPPLLLSVRLRNLTFFKGSSIQVKMRKRSSRKPSSLGQSRMILLKNLILVKYFFSLLDIAFWETKCANLTVLTNLSKDLTLVFDA